MQKREGLKCNQEDIIYRKESFLCIMCFDVTDLYLYSYAEQMAYNVVTVGAPTAYNLKYRNGGLIKWQTTPPYCYAK